MNDFSLFLIGTVLMTASFVFGALLTSETSTYKLGREAKSLLEQCELPLSREQFCELIAKPTGE